MYKLRELYFTFGIPGSSIWGVKNCEWFLRTKQEAIRFMLVGVSAFVFFFYLLAFFYGEAEVVGIVEVTGGAV